MKNQLPILIYTISIWFFIIACSGDTDRSFVETKPVGDVDTLVATGGKYIKFEDAGELLPAWSKENIVIFHITAEPDNMHPTNGRSRLRALINNYLQMPVIAYNLEDLSLRPCLVKSMPEISEDQLEFTYELRDEPAWDNGERLSVEDIIFTLKANKCPLLGNPHAKPYLEQLEDVITYNDIPLKFTLVMKTPYIQNISFLTDFPIMQRSYFDPENILEGYSIPEFDSPGFDPDKHEDLNNWAMEFNDAKYGRDPAYIKGLGAYQFTSWDAGQTITLTRKTNHWTQKLTEPSIYETSYPEKIIFKVNMDKNSQMLEFKSQVLDASTGLSTKTLLDLRKDDNFNKNYYSAIVNAFSYSYAAMNMRPDGVKHEKFFTSKRVRKAMALLTPVEDIIKVVKKGVGQRIAGPVSPLKVDHNNDLKLIPLDIEEAKRLLDKEGWIDTDLDNIRDKVIDGEKVQFIFDLYYMTSEVEWKDIAQMISESMYDAGIKANLKPLEFAVLYEKVFHHDFDMMLGAWSGNSQPEDHTQLWHTSSWKDRGSNFTGFGNALSDALIDSLKVSLDPDRRKKLSWKFQQIVYDEQPYIFLTSSTRKVVIHKRFGNANIYYEKPHVIINNLICIRP